MGFLAYLPHVIYSTALTSISVHHLYQRKAAESERAHVAAQISILEDLRARLSQFPPFTLPTSSSPSLPPLTSPSPSPSPASSNVPEPEPLTDREFDRLWRLALTHDVWRARSAAAAAEDAHLEGGDANVEIGWKEVLLGRRFDTARTEELDQKDLERVRMEVENSSAERR